MNNIEERISHVEDNQNKNTQLIEYLGKKSDQNQKMYQEIKIPPVTLHKNEV